MELTLFLAWRLPSEQSLSIRNSPADRFRTQFFAD
jgi:hypothetical protein